LKECVLKEGICTNCGECDACDLEPDKKCTSCGKCIESDAESRAIQIDDVIVDL